jgi:hypothetical protein
MLLETVIDRSTDSISMRLNGGEHKFNPDDFTTWWAATLPCLGEMLRLSFFEMDPESPRFCSHKETICRVALRAKAVSPTDSIEDRYVLDPSYWHGFAEYLSRLQGTSQV